MAEGRRTIETITALVLGMIIGYAPYISVTHAKPIPVSQKVTIQDIAKKLKEMKVDPAETIDCEALYDVIQSAQTLYITNCPGP